jgi:hypothetical protein
MIKNGGRKKSNPDPKVSGKWEPRDRKEKMRKIKIIFFYNLFRINCQKFYYFFLSSYFIISLFSSFLNLVS